MNEAEVATRQPPFRERAGARLPLWPERSEGVFANFILRSSTLPMPNGCAVPTTGGLRFSANGRPVEFAHGFRAPRARDDAGAWDSA